ncbi:hypothetical protein [Kitasatospora sp. NPDC096140]|uniref:hypothetical protein n=1 Tax=Kitasatospora sp. NPDC096140 TaxID=3155425 RepID=UPI00331EFD8C
MTEFTIEAAAPANSTNPETLVVRAAQVLRGYNEAAMTGPTLNPMALTEAFDGLIALFERLPNTLCHLSGHLMSSQRQGTLLDPLGRDTDELAERVRQRCYDTAEAIPPMTERLRQARQLVISLAPAAELLAGPNKGRGNVPWAPS